MSSETIKQIAGSIAAELRENPERWAKTDYAFDHNGASIDPTDEGACSWCLLGHMMKRSKITCEEFARGFGFNTDPALSLSDWNDAPERTVADIIARCEAVANG